MTDVPRLAPTPSTPCGSPSTHLQCRRPARGRGMMCTLIHRSSALRASTDAYGACILRMRENLLCSGLHMRPCSMTLRRSQDEHPDRRARLFTRETLGKSKNVTPEESRRRIDRTAFFSYLCGGSEGVDRDRYRPHTQRLTTGSERSLRTADGATIPGGVPLGIVSFLSAALLRWSSRRD